MVGQTLVESLCELGEVLRAVQSQHGVQKPRATRHHHGMELREIERHEREDDNGEKSSID